LASVKDYGSTTSSMDIRKTAEINYEASLVILWSNGMKL